MVDFFISIFFAAAMVCLLALPVTATFFFVKGYNWPTRKKYVLQFFCFAVGFVLCLAVSGRIYDATLTPEERSILEQEASATQLPSSESSLIE